MSRSLAARAAAIAGSAIALTVAAAVPALAAPDPHAKLPDGVESKLNTLLGFGMALVIVACVAGVFVCAGKLALAIRHGEGSEVIGKLAGVGFACVLVGSGAGIVNYLV